MLVYVDSGFVLSQLPWLAQVFQEEVSNYKLELSRMSIQRKEEVLRVKDMGASEDDTLRLQLEAMRKETQEVHKGRIKAQQKQLVQRPPEVCVHTCVCCCHRRKGPLV